MLIVTCNMNLKNNSIIVFDKASLWWWNTPSAGTCALKTGPIFENGWKLYGLRNKSLIRTVKASFCWVVTGTLRIISIKKNWGLLYSPHIVVHLVDIEIARLEKGVLALWISTNIPRVCARHYFCPSSKWKILVAVVLGFAHHLPFIEGSKWASTCHRWKFPKIIRTESYTTC